MTTPPVSLLGIEGLKSISVPACIVYFIVSDGEVVYVGRTRRVWRRLAAHGSWKRFEGFYYVECTHEESIALEQKYINELRPRMNRPERTGVCTKGTCGYYKWFNGRTRYVCSWKYTPEEADAIWVVKLAKLKRAAAKAKKLTLCARGSM
jgi:hypothetical protein